VASGVARIAPGAEFNTRFATIDAFRGFAALWVALYHFYNALLPGPTARPWGSLLHAVLSHGYLGVYVFFVLSGFVIARNFYQLPVTLGIVGRFALRRSIRLDPTYWAVIALTLALEGLKSWYGIGQERYWETDYSPAELAANLFYLHKLLDYSAIVAVGWTLCLEIQFYLVFAFAEWLSCVVDRRGGTGSLATRRAVFGLLYLWSIAAFLFSLGVPLGFPPSRQGLFIDYWYAFYLGALAWWTTAGLVSWKSTTLVLLLQTVVVYGGRLAIAGGPLEGDAYEHLTGAVTAMLTTAVITGMGLRGRLITSLQSAVVQYFGRISYSFYLIHPLVGNRGTRIALTYLPGAESLGVVGTVGIFAAAFCLSVAAAHVLYVAVERPTHRFSRKISLTAK
jgi:peptidoglycan/LPS O-acetylase OafA/YrhL